LSDGFAALKLGEGEPRLAFRLPLKFALLLGKSPEKDGAAIPPALGCAPNSLGVVNYRLRES